MATANEPLELGLWYLAFREVITVSTDLAWNVVFEANNYKHGDWASLWDNVKQTEFGNATSSS